MTLANEATQAGGLAPPAEVKVWDRFVRLFHWSLVGLFALAYATGDEIQRVHIAAGYGIAALLTLRVLWGLVGPRHARFTSFVRSPHAMLADLRDVVLGRARRRLGHTPAGGAMILALLAMISATCVTGVMMTTSSYWGVKWVEEVHEALANGTVALIALHVAGVILVSFSHRENLVKAMVTGNKRRDD